jgi:predicted aconitase
MKLTQAEQAMLAGKQGRATQKAMEILVALGTIYGAARLVPVSSVQVSGVSYANLGEAGLQFLAEMADGGGRARVLTTLNPAGMDIENWQALGISQEFADNQIRVLETFARMNIITTASCTPYLIGNTPHFGEHIAWAESSAVCYANSVLGARTNREGGPSALAASLTGLTAAYGYHLDEARLPTIMVEVKTKLEDNSDFGALGKAIGERVQGLKSARVPFIRGIPTASMENLKSFSASVATYGGVALYHMVGITPEAPNMTPPQDGLVITKANLDRVRTSMIARIAELLEGKKVTKEFWITTARPTKQIADMMGYTAVIEAAGAKFAADTCCVVAPIEGRFTAMATDSAKACYYGSAKNKFRTVIMPFDEVILNALGE